MTSSCTASLSTPQWSRSTGIRSKRRSHACTTSGSADPSKANSRWLTSKCCSISKPDGGIWQACDPYGSRNETGTMHRLRSPPEAAGWQGSVGDGRKDGRLGAARSNPGSQAAPRAREHMCEGNQFGGIEAAPDVIEWSGEQGAPSICLSELGVGVIRPRATARRWDLGRCRPHRRRAWQARLAGRPPRNPSHGPSVHQAMAAH